MTCLAATLRARGRLLAVLLVVAAAPRPAAQEARDPDREAREQLQVLIEAARRNPRLAELSDQGRVEGPLRVGAPRRLTMDLVSGAQVVFVAGCDSACSRLKLVLQKDGEVVATDTQDGALPMLLHAVSSSGRYDLEMRLEACSVEPCSAAAARLGTPADGITIAAASEAPAGSDAAADALSQIEIPIAASPNPQGAVTPPDAAAPEAVASPRGIGAVGGFFLGLAAAGVLAAIVLFIRRRRR